MSELNELFEELKQTRDELRVQMNLASREARDEWEDLEEKMEEFSGKAKEFADEAGLKETGKGLGHALSELGHEIKLGYTRILDAIKAD